MGNKRGLGKRHSDETKLLIAAKAKGRKLSAAHRARIIEANIGNRHTAGRTLSDDHRAKVSAGLIGAWATSRSKEAASDRLRARWADPVWKGQQLQKIAAAKSAKRNIGVE